MPKPRRGESQSAYVARYMASPEAQSSFPDEKQRAAVAYSEWKRRKRKKKSMPTMTLEQLVESINSRKAVSAYGISTASAYMRAMVPCLTGGDLCPVKLFKLASAELWAKELAEAAGRLTYCNEQMADPDFLSKSVREGTDITKDCVLEYDCILSSKRKDRDKDVVHQKGGLDVDLKMPLLWQHIQVSPIGKHVALLDQDDTITKSRFAIADTELGRDAATLVKFGSLRKSIGFKPFDFSPIEIIKGTDGKDHVNGWEIKKSACMEGSLVSIPANPDAVILSTYAKEFDGLATAHSRGLLKHPMIRHWAKGIYDLRPAQVRGADLATKDGTPGETKATLTLPDGSKLELSTKSGQAQASPQDGKTCPECGKNKLDSAGECANCGFIGPNKVGGKSSSAGMPCPTCGSKTRNSKGDCQSCGKAFETITGETKSAKNLGSLDSKAYGNEYIDGSFEKVQSMLRRTASNYLSGKGVDVSTYSSYAELLATFDDSAIICLYSYGAVKSPCYRVSYTKDAEGNATWSGEPAEVEVKQQIIEKRIAELGSKQEPLSALARKLAARMVTADGANADVDAAHETVSKAFATLKQSRESFSFEELLN